MSRPNDPSRAWPASDELRDAAETRPAGRRHFLTVAVEEYYHATALSDRIGGHHRRRLETHLDRNVDRVIELLGRHEARATFFALGALAESHPGAIRRIIAAGHELAARTWSHAPISAFTPEAFREEVRRAKRSLEDVTGAQVLGFRIAESRFRPMDYWALRILAEEGYAYDSSLYPRGQELWGRPWRRFPHLHEDGETRIWEFPLSSWGADGFLLPLAGGNSIRQLPAWMVRMAVADWTARYRSPFNMYFNVWELDPELPRLAVGGWLRKLRLYRNLDRMPELLGYFLHEYRFGPIGDHVQTLSRDAPLECDSEVSHAQGTFPSPPALTLIRPAPSDAGENAVVPAADAFTVVIPCYNEESVLAYLDRALGELSTRLAPRPLRLVFVDDGSADGTVALLRHLYGQREGVQIVVHERNRGVAAAIMTGIAHAKTELVGSMDCDCTYDPVLFAEMIELLDEETAMVTSSPYHPSGTVRQVPAWRLTLSKSLSWMYRRLMRNKLYTYTSCFRVYRRSKMADIELQSGGFLGMAEMIARLDERGQRVRELPAVLESRILGYSKMRTLRTILEHLGLLRRLAVRRVFGYSAKPS